MLDHLERFHCKAPYPCYWGTAVVVISDDESQHEVFGSTFCFLCSLYVLLRNSVIIIHVEFCINGCKGNRHRWKED